MKKSIFFILVFGIIIYPLFAQQEDETCFECHKDSELSTTKDGKSVSLFVHQQNYAGSVHNELGCVGCHADIDPDDLPHATELEKVDCSGCHDTETFMTSIHAQGKIECSSCHTKHAIQPAADFAETIPGFCVECHKTASVKNYTRSVHYSSFMEGEASPNCLDCHSGSAHTIAQAEIDAGSLHEMCGTCHDKAVTNFEKSLHGDALAKGLTYAPDCTTCHNVHEIRSSKDSKSKTYVMNIPALCGECHKEGTPVSKLRTISQHDILDHYSESIHGEGLLKRGLIVTAVCTSCHFSHNILRHQDPNSSINRNNVAKTCMQCHTNIEEVHTKVIKGELWEKEPHKIPACIDCHQPHDVRRVYYEDTMADQMCVDCHSNPNLSKTVKGEKISLYVDYKDHKGSAHKDNSCIKCHSNVSVSNNPVCLNSGPVDCSACHAEHVAEYNISSHGKLVAQGNTDAPYCTDCHGKHNIQKKDVVTSPSFRRNIPAMCDQCHKSGGVVDSLGHASQHNVDKNYAASIHGKGLTESGLLVSATCVDCHTPHRELPAGDMNSSINKNNIAETCAVCHFGIYEKFKTSIHSPTVTITDKRLPVCDDCHTSHTIGQVSKGDFRQQILNQCGECHSEVTNTYFETFHGKVSTLGADFTAKCHDCHGAHNILPVTNPASTLHRNNIVETCKSCHPQSNRKFVGYLTHATHHDKEKYPALFYTFWAMTILLVSTFTFFGIHTLLWMPRALAEKRKHNKLKKEKTGRNNV